MNGETHNFEALAAGKIEIRRASADCHDAFIALRKAIIRHEVALRGNSFESPSGERGKGMKLTLVDAIRYLENNVLPAADFISLTLYGEEGYELQRAVKGEQEGATTLSLHPILKERGYSEDYGSHQFNGLMREIGKADLAIQFINSFPIRNNDEGDDLNLRVVIMRRETLWKALRQFETCQDVWSGSSVAPVPVLNGFKGNPAKPRKPRKAALATN